MQSVICVVAAQTVWTRPLAADEVSQIYLTGKTNAPLGSGGAPAPDYGAGRVG